MTHLTDDIGCSFSIQLLKHAFMLLQQNDFLGIFSLRGIKKQLELNCLVEKIHAFVLFYFLFFNAPLKSYHVIHLSSKVIL